VDLQRVVEVDVRRVVDDGAVDLLVERTALVGSAITRASSSSSSTVALL
jgi:hypothetical protein